MTPTWTLLAERLADAVTSDAPEWWEAVASTPRHLLVPHWWERIPSSPREQWVLRPTTGSERMDRAYRNQTLVTRVGASHADHAKAGQLAAGGPTSSSTLPGLIVTMLHWLNPQPGTDRVLDIGTGSGYSAALMSRRLGDDAVTSIDVDQYLTQAARARLASMGLQPTVETADATMQAPGSRYSHMMATVSARPIPASWLFALSSGGRLVATIAGTTLLIVADMQPSGIASGRVVSDSTSFMQTRNGQDYQPRQDNTYALARDADGDDIRRVRGFPLEQKYAVRNLYELDTPGVEVRTATCADGTEVTGLLAHDGSWARFEDNGSKAVVHQAGPRRLWDRLEAVQNEWEQQGTYPLTGSTVALSPEDSTLTTPSGLTFPI